jgi:SAM-dependent methyltransferase
MRGRRVVPIVAGLGAVGLYLLLGILTFKPPADLAEAMQCGFTMADFTAQGTFAVERVPAVMRRFVNQKEYYTAASLGVVIGFLVQSLYAAGAGRFANLGLGLVGGSVLATLIVSTGCVIPLLVTAFFGVAVNVFIPVPKEMMLLLSMGFVFMGTRWAQRKERKFTHRQMGERRLEVSAGAQDLVRSGGLLGLLEPFLANRAHPDPGMLRGALLAALDDLAAGKDVPFRHGIELLRELGYTEESLALLPSATAGRFAGVGNPHRGELIAAGMKVLDAGLSAGADALLAARAVGPTGEVVRLELSAGLAAATPIAGVTTVEGSLLRLPFDDASFDAVLVNGGLSLCHDRARALAEIHRILRPGGVLVLCDLVAQRKLMLRTRHDFTRWVALVGSAVRQGFLEGLLVDSGLSVPTLLGHHAYFHDAPDPVVRGIAEERGVQAVELVARKPARH